MKKTLLAALLCSTVAGGVALAADNFNNQPNQPTQQQGLSDKNKNLTDGTQMNVPDRTSSYSSAFKSLDNQHRGYLTSDDVRNLEGFNANCDTNGDGRISRGEFKTCWGDYQNQGNQGNRR